MARSIPPDQVILVTFFLSCIGILKSIKSNVKYLVDSGTFKGDKVRKFYFEKLGRVKARDHRSQNLSDSWCMYWAY